MILDIARGSLRGGVHLPGQRGQIVQIATGEGHSLVVTSRGQLYAFGRNCCGQLGNETNNYTDNANPVPTLVTLPGEKCRVVQVAAGYADSLAVTSTGQLYAFGTNLYGQLGTEVNAGEVTVEGHVIANPTPVTAALPGKMRAATVARGSSAEHTVVVGRVREPLAHRRAGRS